MSFITEDEFLNIVYKIKKLSIQKARDRLENLFGIVYDAESIGELEERVEDFLLDFEE